MMEETTPTPETPTEAKPAKATPPAKKPKEPAVEDKPFTEFIEQNFTPTLKEALARQGIKDIELNFSQDKLPITGMGLDTPCWQLTGDWYDGKRQFNIYFLDEDINGQKAFSYSTNGAKASTIESFMIDERKVTLDLMVMYTLQRLNGQKWLSRN